MVFERIRDIISNLLNKDKESITLEASFDSLQVDSLELIQIIIEIEESFNIRIEDEEGLNSVKDVVDYVEKKYLVDEEGNNVRI
ncbi:MAG TPA: acyl carrier protein [Clostridiaceae bacterium]